MTTLAEIQEDYDEEEDMNQNDESILSIDK